MKTKNFLFKLVMVFMSLVPVNALGWELSKVIRINPGDTICSSQLTEKTHDMYVGSHISHMDLIIVKNGGDFVLKIDSLNPMSYPADENNCIRITSNGWRIFTFEKLNGQEFTLDFIVNYHGVPFLEGNEIEMNDTITINSDKDLEKKVTIPFVGINWWYASISHNFDFDKDEIYHNTNELTLGEILTQSKTHFPDHSGTINIFIEFHDRNGLIIENPPTDEGLFLGLDGSFDTRISSFTFTIKDNRTVSGISSTSVDELQKKSVIYDLQGRPISSPQRGIYIVNGKKVLYR